MSHFLFISCTSGFESVLQKELQDLSYTGKIAQGGVSVSDASLYDAMFLNMHLRTASRVLLRLSEISVPSKNSLYKMAYDYDWKPFFQSMPTFAITVPFMEHPDFTNSMYISQLIKDGICDRLRKETGQRPSVDKNAPQMQFHVVVTEDVATIYFDTSNIPLFKRGYRVEQSEAPLKETVAAAILYLASYDKQKILCDPCAGSGTFLIEAALMAANCAPGIFRSEYGFMSHPEYDAEAFFKIKEDAQNRIVPIEPSHIFGIEKESSAYRKALRSIVKTGFIDSIQIIQGDFRKITPPVPPNCIITNPPFGIRLGNPEQHKKLYEELGDFLKRKTKKPATAAVLTSSLELAQAIRLKPKQKTPLFHGGLKCFLWQFDMYT